jgi:hypothetical protein
MCYIMSLVSLADYCMLFCFAVCCRLQLPQLPAALTQLIFESCRSLRQLPPLAHTKAQVIDISECPLLTEIPDLPVDHLQSLYAASLPRVTRLPALRKDKHYETIFLNCSGVIELPDQLPRVDEFCCSHTAMQQQTATHGWLQAPAPAKLCAAAAAAKAATC